MVSNNIKQSHNLHLFFRSDKDMVVVIKCGYRDNKQKHNFLMILVLAINFTLNNGYVNGRQIINNDYIFNVFIPRIYT